MSGGPGEGRATDDGPPTDDGRAAGNGFLRDTWVNLERWLVKTLRNPMVLALTIVNPLVFFVLFTEVFGPIAGEAVGNQLGGDVGYVTFVTPAILVQVSLVAASTSGIGLVGDIESGMFEKVLVSPMHRGAVFLGKSLSEVLRIVGQVTLILVLGYALFRLDGAPGDYVATGLPGAVGVVGVCVVFTVWFTAFSNVAALLTRDDEATIIATNVLQFPLLFLSSAFLPLSILPKWVQVAAALNPVTYGVDAARALMLGRDVGTVVDLGLFPGMWDTVVPAVGVLLALDVVFGAAAIYALARASSPTVR